jgi:hypothetical protein
MEIACRHYTKKDAIHINRYRLYLRVISLYDLLTYDRKQIHPEFTCGKRVLSRTSTIHWVDFPKPPKKDATLWISFLNTHGKPITTRPIEWDPSSSPTYRTKFMASTTTDKLYQYSDQGILQYKPKQTRRRTKYHTFHKTFTEITLTNELRESLFHVEVCNRSNDIQILCESRINTHHYQSPDTGDANLTDLYSRLPISLQRLCGSVSFPEDGGSRLIQYIS